MADFTLVPDFVFSSGKQYKTLVSNFENGAEQRRQAWGSAKRKFELQFVNRTATDFTTLQNFFDSKKGRLTSFTFENPNDSTEYTVRFDDDELMVRRIGPITYDFSCNLVEVS